MGYAFLAPTLVGVFVFTIGPIFASLALSLFNWDIITPAQFVGLRNYHELIRDSTLAHAFGVTAVFVVIAVSAEIVLGLFLAMLVEQQARPLRALFRSIFFFPLLTSAASISIVLSFMFDDKFGVVNYYLGLLHIAPVPWLSSGPTALLTTVIVFLWQQVGFTFIVFTAALGNLPGDVLDAAAVDGARGLRRLWHITLPLLSPTVFFVAVVGVINALQIFDQAYVLTRGGPGEATLTVVLLLYQTAFSNLQFGYAAGIAVALFIAILLVTGLQFLVSRRWVFYQ